MNRYITYLFLLSFLNIAACKSENNKTTAQSDPITVVTEAVKLAASGTELTVSGNIEGNKTVRIGFMVAGKINFIAAQEGQSVSSGQLVSSLDPTNYSIAKELVDIQVRQVSDEYNRLKIMYERNSVSEGDFKKVGFALEQAQAQQKLHAKNLSDTKLYSPISGVLLKKLAEVGEITGVGNPILVISDISKVKVNAYIPENELHTVRLGQSASVKITSLDSTYTGKVVEVGSAADPTSRAFTIKVELPNPQWLIRPGMIAEVKLSSGHTKNIIGVPTEAVMKDLNNQSYVYVADVVQNKAFKRKVSLGNLFNNQIEITSGLNDGETVVTGGQQKLTDGSSITITK
jgi:RND family efflux transporter MFP subunit